MASKSARLQGGLVALLVAVVLIPAALGSSGTIFSDGDVSWHLAAGQWMLDHRAIPTVDPFSFTRAGTPWVPIEWGAELMFASVFRLAGYAGVAALVTAALVALHAVVFGNAVRSIRPLAALGAVVLMDLTLIPMLLARPHVLTWPLLALWTWLMLRSRGRDRSPPLVAALLMTLWANLHGSFVFGLAIAAVFALEALIASADRARAFRRWLLFGLASALAVCINANGIAGVLHPFDMASMTTLPLIDEWKHSSPSVTPFFFAVLAITIALVAWKRPRLHAVRWALLAALLALALYQVRQQAMLAIVAAVVLPGGFAAAPRRSPGIEREAVLAAGGLAAVLIAVRAALPLAPPASPANPWALIAAVPPELRAQPVLNDFSMGGPLILAGIRPFIDGRGDLYGDAFMADYARIAHGDPGAFAAAVRRWNIRWAILSHGDRRMIALVERAGWRRIASDKVGEIYVRPRS